MFVVVTVAGAWLGWGVRQAQQRASYLTLDYITATGLDDTTPSAGDPAQLPLSWRLGGARPVRILCVLGGFRSQQEERRIISLFPEAEIQVGGMLVRTRD
jgi:hypothetical protein